METTAIDIWALLKKADAASRAEITEVNAWLKKADAASRAEITEVNAWLNENGPAPSWASMADDASYAYKFGIAAETLRRAVRVIERLEAEAQR